MIALALLAAVALADPPPPPAEPRPPPASAERARPQPRPSPNPPPRGDEEDAEIIRHLDELQKLELLRQLQVFDPDLDEEGAGGARK